MTFQVFETEHVPIKAWTRGVPFEEEALNQLRNVAQMPFVRHHVAVMPDVHAGIGATVGSVVACRGAIIQAAVGVDIGCGMMAVRTSLKASQLPDNLSAIRSAIEAAVPHGRSDRGGVNDQGAYASPLVIPTICWNEKLAGGYKAIGEKHPKILHKRALNQLGTLGTGNHFIEICIDEEQRVWIMLHSGSRGPGNAVGSYFIEKAKEDMRRWFINLPDVDLAYLPEGSDTFDDYLQAVTWAQDYALLNRELMMTSVVNALESYLPAFKARTEAVNCHHNYVARERHYGENLIVTRKGAVRARTGDLGIIPGSMGAKSFIVRGKGNRDSFESCSHGAGRVMSRTKAKATFSLKDHEQATAGIECRKDYEVLDETPGAYKSIDAVMNAQADLVEIVHTLKQVVCVKG